jgi:hypothetical protein
VTDLDAEVRADTRFERKLFWRELLIVAVTAALVVVRAIVG